MIIITSLLNRLLLIPLGCFLIAGLIGGCDRPDPAPAAGPLRVGVTAGPHAEIMEVVKDQAAAAGLNLQIVVFDDYQEPNLALARGEIDANSFQPRAYLDYFLQDHKYDLTAAGPTIFFPLGLYAKKITDFSQINPPATVAIPSDPINSGRALVLLEKAGLIKLRPGTGFKAALTDIAENPQALNIQEIEEEQIPYRLENFALVALTSYNARSLTVPPTALIQETADSPYVNILAVRSADRDDPALTRLLAIYHSPAVKAFIKENYAGLIEPAW